MQNKIPFKINNKNLYYDSNQAMPAIIQYSVQNVELTSEVSESELDNQLVNQEGHEQEEQHPSS